MGQRLVRAKHKIKQAHIPFRARARGAARTTCRRTRCHLCGVRRGLVRANGLNLLAIFTNQAEIEPNQINGLRPFCKPEQLRQQGEKIEVWLSWK
jgi:hypothetical protein